LTKIKNLGILGILSTKDDSHYCVIGATILAFPNNNPYKIFTSKSKQIQIPF